MARLLPICLIALASVLAAPSAHAVPAPPFPITVRNGDGSSFQARMFGDEHLSWLEDLEGFTLAFDDASRDWHYARPGPTGRLVPSGTKVGSRDPRSLRLSAHLRPPLDQRRLALRMRPPVRTTPLPPGETEVRNLVLLVKFANQTPYFNALQFDQVFNGAGNSVQTYYREISYNRVKLVSTIVDWIPLPHDDRYYAYNDRNPFGRPEQMIRDAVAYLETKGFDFTRFDANKDGIIDAVDVIHSGDAYETTGNSNYIHSHYADLRWGGGGAFTTRDGIQFVAYHTEPEFGPSGMEITQLGVICHETAHFFGLPDLYDYDYDSSGLGLWSLMSAGSWGGPHQNGSRPSHPDAWSKFKLGYIEPTRITQSMTGLALKPVALNPEVMLIDSGMPTGEYFMIENRRRAGFDNSIPGEGLAIYHVDENQPNQDDQNHYLVDLEQADGLRQLNRSAYARGDGGDVFPYLSNRAFTSTSNPSSTPYAQGFTPLAVTNIARRDADVTFDIAIAEPRAVGLGCASDGECASGFCVSGICCDKACDGACEACTLADGAPADGVCSPLSGKPCEDGNGCTENESCQQGACVGQPVTCPGDACHLPGYCDIRRGGCVNQMKDEGSPCDDGNACTRTDACYAGTCYGTEPLVCGPSLDECHQAPSCDPARGLCDSAPLPDGTRCSLGVCTAGVCAPEPAPEKKGCGCATGGLESAPLAGLFALLALRRRRASLMR